MNWEDVMRDGAHALIYEHPERLERIILGEMLNLSNRGLIPTWGHYKTSPHWLIVQKYLNAEEQFVYRTRWSELLRNTFPSAQPDALLPSHVS